MAHNRGWSLALCVTFLGLIVPLNFALSEPQAKSSVANRLTYLDEPCNPYYPHRDFPKLITPQWVGEEGVEAVIILAIDDMRGHAKWEQYLRPILNRLKQIDGRAPVSIMTCNIDPQHPHLQQWLNEGLSLEAHTVDHPCPLLQGGDFAKAKSTYDRCFDLMHEIPNNKPVAFRMPCCDSLNTLSPRFFTEIFNKQTAKGHSLQIDTSVFNVFTSDDPALPRELVLDKNGAERFKGYLPADRTFVNTIENYPYPYVIDHLCWEFPCLTPNDWAAQHKQKPNNPGTVEDWKAAIDCTVIKQGVVNLVFHPHGWISSEQVNEMIDHAVQKHGNKVKFLTFREALDRINKNLLNGGSLRSSDGLNSEIKLLDLDQDGYLDVVKAKDSSAQSFVWSSTDKTWKTGSNSRIDLHSLFNTDPTVPPTSMISFGSLSQDGKVAAAIHTESDGPCSLLIFSQDQWKTRPSIRDRIRDTTNMDVITRVISDVASPMRDIDGDSICEWLVTDAKSTKFYALDKKQYKWNELPVRLPENVQHPGLDGRDTGLRFVDLDEDGHDDILFSNHERYSIHLWDPSKQGWTRQILASKRGEKPADQEIPPIIRADGSNNGFWVHSGLLVWQNEDTAKMPDLIDRRSIKLLLRDVEPGPKSAAEGLKTLKARPGFTVEQMAAEPLTMDPVAFEWGADGKLWVAEMADYPKGLDGQGKPGGRIRYLEDTNGDGKYDKTTLFLDDVPFPTGVMPWKKGVLVSTAPDVFYAEDTDGDGKADKREVLYTGFAEGNQQHRVNGLVWGLDNWIYLANGDSGGTVKSLKTGKTVAIGGRDLRIHPETVDLDTVTGQSQFGRNRDDWGNWFGCNNANPMYQFVMEDRYLRRNPHFAGTSPVVHVSNAPGASPCFPLSTTRARFNDLHTANRFTSACSTMVYRDDLFGDAFNNSCFISEPVHNLVHREVMTRNGATFSSRRADDEQRSEFLASSDNWCRPTMTKTGPDGALWVADMYRHVIEHPEWIPLDWQARLDLRAGHDKGRLYRVFPSHAKPRSIPRLDTLSTLELVNVLNGPDAASGWTRDTVQRLLIERNDNAAVKPLEVIAQQATRPLSRVHALCTLDGLNALTPEVIHANLVHPEPQLRRQAVRLVESLKTRPDELLAALHKLSQDPDALVQMQLAFTLGELNDANSARVLGEMAIASKVDSYQFTAAMSSVNQKNFESVLLAVLNRPDLHGTDAGNIERLLEMASKFGNADLMLKLLDEVTKLHDDKWAAWQFNAVATLMKSQARQSRPLLEILNQSTKPEAARILKELRRLAQAAARVAVHAEVSTTHRIAAIKVMSGNQLLSEQNFQILTTLMLPNQAMEIRLAAAEAISQSSAANATTTLIESWKSCSPALRSFVLDLLLSRSDGPAGLLTAIENKKLEPHEFDAARRQRLTERFNGEQRDRAIRLLAAGTSSRANVLRDYQTAISLAGDASRGQMLFAKTCAQCHKLIGAGFEVGPDLTALTDKSPEAMLTAILDPNRAVEAKFLNYTAVTKSGRQFSGLLSAESGNSITLRAPEAKEFVILREELEELVGSSKSTMPEGLEKDLKPQDVADIIAYVRANVTLPKRKEFEGNVPAVVSGGSGGAIELTSKTCEIYGPSLILENLYGNLGYWTSPEDLAVWTLDVKRPGKYKVTFDCACDNSTAGQTWQLDIGTQSLTGKTAGTGTWDDYRQIPFGEITLDPGRQRVTLRSTGPLTGALLDLKAIRLTK
jgi:putative membrane-bound dehydrogenase-like protein